MRFRQFLIFALILSAPDPRTASAQVDVLTTYWEPPRRTDFTIDSTVLPTGSAAATPWLDANHDLTAAEIRMLVDRMCAVWARTTDVASAVCFGRRIANIPGGHAWDGANGFAFRTGSRTGFGHTGNTWCYALYPAPDASECDYYLVNDTDAPPLRWRTFHNTYAPTGSAGSAFAGGFPVIQGPGNFRFARRGTNRGADFYVTGLHEVGHALGLWHETPSCVPSASDCPVMSQATRRVAWWPTRADSLAMRERHNIGPRQVRVSIWDIDDNGRLIPLTNWMALPNVLATVPPRISCSAGRAGLRFNSCVVSVIPWGRRAPDFHYITPNPASGGSVSIGRTIRATAFAEGAVDVAMDGDRSFFAVGRRPADQPNSSHRLVTYHFSNLASRFGGQVLTSRTLLARGVPNADTHTEPRVTYHSASKLFVAAFPDATGNLQIAAFNGDGGFRRITGIPEASLWPVEITCDAHLRRGRNDCRIYFNPYEPVAAARAGRFKSCPVEVTVRPDAINFNAADCNFGDFAHRNTLVADASTYAPKREGQFGWPFSQGAYFLTVSRPSFLRPLGRPTALLMDSDGQFDPADISARSHTVGGLQGNVTSWDWNEQIGAFVAVTLQEMLILEE